MKKFISILLSIVLVGSTAAVLYADETVDEQAEFISEDTEDSEPEQFISEDNEGSEPDHMKNVGKNDDGSYKYELQEPDAKITRMIQRTRADLRKAGATFVDLSDVVTDEYVEETFRHYFGPGFAKSTTEYDLNKYFFEHGENAPYNTLKELLSTGKFGIDYSNLYYDAEDIGQMADSFEETETPYTIDVNGFMRVQTWNDIWSDRAFLADAMDQKDVDAIIFVLEMNVPIHDTDDLWENEQYYHILNGTSANYANTFGSFVGCPDMVLPMGFSETDETCPVPMPVGMHFVGRFGDERALMQIAYAYEQQAGPDIRQIPESSPALRDDNLNAFLEALMDEVYSLDYSMYFSKPEGKIKLMESAYDRAAAAETSDPYAVYHAAYDLAKAYDKTKAALEVSGYNLAYADAALKNTSYTYSGAERKPSVTVTFNGNELVKDTDYTVSYNDNINVGTAMGTLCSYR